jgi:hypothetical protein
MRDNISLWSTTGGTDWGELLYRWTYIRISLYRLCFVCVCVRARVRACVCVTISYEAAAVVRCTVLHISVTSRPYSLQPIGLRRFTPDKVQIGWIVTTTPNPIDMMHVGKDCV